MEGDINIAILQDTETSILTKNDDPNTAISIANPDGSLVSFAGLNLSGIGIGSSASFVNLPIISESNLLNGTQNFVLATAPDGSRTFLIEASQLALLTQEGPFPDNGSIITPAALPTVGSLTSESHISILASQIPASPGEITNNNNNKNSERESRLPTDEVIQPPLKKGPFKCDSCIKEFPKYSQYKRHQKLHLEDKPFRCAECDCSFNYESNLVLHSATHCKEGVPTCPECEKTFSRIASLRAHVKLHEKEENIVCLECGEELTTQRQMDIHIKQHVEEASAERFYYCRHCSQKFKIQAALKEHMKIHVRLRASLHHRSHKKNIDRSSFPHKCDNCEKVFQKPSQLVRHKRIHTGERPFKCDICDKAFNQKGALQIHKTKHSGIKQFVCEFCNAAFSQRGNLRNHIQRVHTLSLEPNQTRYQCIECSCVFRKIGNLNAHLSKMHSSYTPINNEPSSVQEEGQQVIKQLMDLSRHANRDDKNKENESNKSENSDLLQQALENIGLTTESKEKGVKKRPQLNEAENNAYKISPASILRRRGESRVISQIVIPNNSTAPMVMQVADNVTGIMKRHIVRKVGGILWHQCVYCSKEFKKPSDLVRHIRIHTHEKPYKCQFCYRAFSVTSTLKAHLKVHTGAKDYHCEICKKDFSTQGSLKVHNRLHTGSRPFHCSFKNCDRQFRTSGHRKSHMLSHEKKNTKKLKKDKSPNAKDRPSFSHLPLQEPILITDAGLVQPSPKNPKLHQGNEENELSADRPYHCPTCSRGFKKSSHLKQHIRSHTGEKPFRCIQCQRCFVSNGALKAHVFTHSGEKRFICRICNTSFTTQGSLKRHMSTHSSERPYMCPYCQKTFKTCMDCKKHLKTHRPKFTISTDNTSNNLAIHPNDEEEQSTDAAINGVDDVEGTTGSPEEQQMDHESGKEALVEISQIVDGFEAIVTAENDVGQSLADAVSLPQETVTLNSQTFTHQQILSRPNLQVLRNSFAESLASENEENIDSPEFLSHFTVGNFTIQVPTDQIDVNETLSPSFNNPTLTSANMESILPNENERENARNSLSILTQVPGSENETNSRMDDDGGVETWSDNQKNDGFRGSKKKIYRCDYCGKHLKKASHLQQHLRVHSKEKPFPCEQCKRTFSSVSVLNAHVKTHLGLKEFQCKECGAAFTTNGSLGRHAQIHCSASFYSCSICDNQFRNKHLFYKHMKAHKDESELLNKGKKTGVLQLSSEQAEEIAKLTLPETASVSEKVLIASAAEKDRISEVKDKYLELQKLPQFAHQCEHCPKSFRKPSDLIRHIRTHTGEKPFPCPLCKKSFTVKSTLDCHLKTHSGEKNYNCHVCNAFFATKGSLKVHMRLHTGSKPFKCPHCELKFRTSGHRKSHISTHFRESARKKSLLFRKPEPILERSATTPLKSTMETTLFESSVEEDDLPGTLPEDAFKGVTENSEEHLTQTVNGIQLQIPSSLLGQNIQITGIDPSTFLQQFQGGNINITISHNDLIESNGEDYQVATTTAENGDQFLQTLSGSSPLVSLNSNGLTAQLNALGLTLDQAQMMANMSDGTTTVTTNSVPLQITIDQDGKSLIENAGVIDVSEVSLTHKEMTLDVDDQVNLGGELIANMLKEPATQRHKEPSNHKCETCGKHFQRPSLLERHRRIHSGERPFSCKFCDKKFNQTNALQIHVKSKHLLEKQYTCPECGMAFTQKGNLKTHVKRVHPGCVEL